MVSLPLCPIAQNAVCVKRLGWGNLPFKSSYIEDHILRSFSKIGLYLTKREASSTWSTAFRLYASSRKDRGIHQTTFKSKYAQVWEGVENWETCPVKQPGPPRTEKDSCSLELIVCVSVVPQCLVDRSRKHLWRCEPAEPVVFQRVGDSKRKASASENPGKEGSYLLAIEKVAGETFEYHNFYRHFQKEMLPVNRGEP